jgi:RNA-directed DNA polymerase
MNDLEKYIDKIKEADPIDIRDQFYSLSSFKELSKIIKLPHNWLKYYLYVFPEEKKYKVFTIPKKSGGNRVITAPAFNLKLIQMKLNVLLQKIYSISCKPSVHGFVFERSIVTNAKVHQNRDFVLNIDMKDFFPSFHFGRVRGLFMAKPYCLNNEVATVLAQICCYNNQLPQGAPTSPIITNMICSKMDRQFQTLARNNKCKYTRYADDITFSSNSIEFLNNLAYIDSNDNSYLGSFGNEIIKILHDNDFKLNSKKTRLQTREFRQEVTGLTVNEFPNVKRAFVRQIRAMLHAWEKFGLENAQNEFISKYYSKHKSPTKKYEPKFKQVLKGKIEFLGMVRGKDNEIYKKFINKYLMLSGKLKKQITIDEQFDQMKKNFELIINDFKKYKYYVSDVIKSNSIIDMVRNEISVISSKIASIEENIGFQKIIKIEEKSDEEPHNISVDTEKEIKILRKMIESFANDITILKSDNKIIKIEIGIDIEPSIDYFFIRDEKTRDQLINDNKKMEREKKKSEFVMYCDYADKQIEYIGDLLYKKCKPSLRDNWIAYENRIIQMMKSKKKITLEKVNDYYHIPNHKFKEWSNNIYQKLESSKNPQRREIFLIGLAACYPENIKPNVLNIYYWDLMNIKNLRDSGEGSHRSIEDSIGNDGKNKYIYKMKAEKDWDKVRRTVEDYVKHLYKWIDKEIQ